MVALIFMLYQFFYYLLKLTCNIYYKKIIVLNEQQGNLQNPLIICANHGNSFMDAILIAIVLKRKLHFLARSDVFNTPFKRWFLSKINMMPIYRIRDGREELKNNDFIFDKCTEILAKNGAVLIFPEGNCIVQKRLRELKSGFAQLAFYSDVPTLNVLPVSINYTNPYLFGEKVAIHFGDYLAVESIKSEANNEPKAFYKLMKDKLSEAIKKNMIIFPKEEDDVFYQQCLELLRIESLNKNEDFIKEHQQVIKEYEIIRQENFNQFQKLKSASEKHFKLLDNLGLHYEMINLSEKKYYLWISVFLLLSPFILCGIAIQFLPVYTTQYIVNKKIKEKQFESSVRMVAGLFIQLIYLSILIIIVGLIIKTYIFSALFIFTTSYIYYLSSLKLKIIWSFFRLKNLKFTNQEVYQLVLSGNDVLTKTKTNL